jgi:serine/threonine protein kinase/tetratricopeptide (TPR) repeat protein
MHDLIAGTQLANRYTLVRKLGTGGAAEIWAATDRLTRASVALKIVASEKFSGELLRQEWKTSIRLMHAHIVRVFEFHDDPDGAFYSLQFVDGPNLSILSAAPLSHILAPLGFIADALRYAHAKGVVHCDIKPGNVVLDHNGAPYLIDFGVASDGAANTGGGSLIAMTPQRLAGESPQAADDIFALGGLIYELVSGRSPYSPTAIAEEIKNTVPPDLVAADGSAVPEAIRNLVATMLDKSAKARPSAEEVTQILATAGYAAGPAPAKYVASHHVQADEVIETKTSVRTSSRHAPASKPIPEAAKQKGISQRTVGISLAALLVLFLGVVFLLPETVTTDKSEIPIESDVEVTGTEAGSGTTEPTVDFNENTENLSERDERVQDRNSTEEVLGELLSKMETLERRAVQRWAGLRYKQAQAIYAEGDTAYLARDYATATEKYGEAIVLVDPLLDEVDAVFASTFDEAQAALAAADAVEALNLFELAVAISPSHAAAQAGYIRAQNLDSVLLLTDQGISYENNLELEAARESFAGAVELDSEWEPAQIGLQRVLATINQMEFDQRMTEGLIALDEGDFLAARAAFRMAEGLQPKSPDPRDGLLQVDQGIRLNRFAILEQSALSQEKNEEWDAVIETYGSILELDGNLEFAKDGLLRARQMTALHAQLDAYIADPDVLSSPSTMQKATNLFLDITRMPQIGPRLGDQRDELSRLLKRAATPLVVQLVSDNATDVSIYKVGKLGSFATHELSLRPGTYVAVGSRAGYRDVRLEFRVAPETDSGPVVVRCEETI